MICKLEVIGFTIEACTTAITAGVHRIELCDNPGEGGTTPSFAFIQAARSIIPVELFVMIRPRGGDFLYNDVEFKMMMEDISICKKSGCDGIVTGILTSEGQVDKARMKHLCALAYPLAVTFHRAFDRTIDPYQALEDIIDTGCERILTSGQKPTAPEGIELLTNLVKKADERIIIMPGAGVTSVNINDLMSTGAIEFHTSARKKIKSNMNYINPGMAESLEQITVDQAEITKILEVMSKRHVPINQPELS